ncbi:restriction endonuclease [Streptomyces pristinaespiralis]|uniref:restriction endonuclease n=1 Tax=Streptomyces pristinaespiralis TaxID=38300 RepID=UPI0033D129BB
MSRPHAVLHDPHALVDEQLPLAREPHMLLVQAVLAWTSKSTVAPRDCEQITLQLSGHARAVAADVRRRCAIMRLDAKSLALTEVVLGEAERRLSTPSMGTIACAQGRARLVRALYERLDCLDRRNCAPAVGCSP